MASNSFLSTTPPSDSFSAISGISVIESEESDASADSQFFTPTGNSKALGRRISLTKLYQERKAKKIRFFRNGDKFHKGYLYILSYERIRTFDALLEDLTRVLSDKSSLPNGVRYVFNINGTEKIRDLNRIFENAEYVCSSTDQFVRLNYSQNIKRRNSMHVTRHSNESLVKWDMDGVKCEPRDFVKPKLITIIRNGSKPRKFVRFLLNKKTAHSFDQVIRDITMEVKMDSGVVKKVYTLDGREVSTLADFFSDDDTFIAFGLEKCAQGDFDLAVEEYKYLLKTSRSSLNYSKFRRDCISVSSPVSSPVSKGKMSSPARMSRESSSSSLRGSPARTVRLQRTPSTHEKSLLLE